MNPTKISGTCGRLMCCLKYEQDAYEELIAKTPNPGALVDTPAGRGSVTSVNLLKGLVSVKLDSKNEKILSEFKVDDVVIIKDGGREKKTEEVDLSLLKELEQD